MLQAHRIKITAIIFLILCLLSQSTSVLSQTAGWSQDNPPENMPFVTVTRIDSTDFPLVAAYVAVIGENGHPVRDLTAQDFHLTEDGEEIAYKSLEVTEYNAQGFNMALAVDVSTYKPESLETVQQALRSFVADMTSYDQISLLVFHNEVETVVPLTGDKKILNQAIDNLSPTGTRTALNAAIMESVNAASSFKPGRGIAVVITNMPDNVGDISAKTVIEHVEQMGIPVYTICYGETQSAHLPDVTQLTRGKHFSITTPNDVQPSLQAVEDLLRQGYKIVFDSELFADDEEHTLVVSYQQLAKRAESPFQAWSGNVTIDLDGLEEQQRVARGDEIPLSASVQAPGDEVYVTYYVDKQQIGQREQAPFEITLNSHNLEPGEHTLRVHAADNVNNTHEKEYAFEVVEPIVVKDFQVAGRVKPGDPITATVWVESLDEIAEVTFQLDETDSVQAENTDSPYSYAFDSRDYPPKSDHTVSARITDAAGREYWSGVRHVWIEAALIAPQRDWSEIGKTLLIIGLILVAIVLAALLLLTFLHHQRRLSEAIYPMEIANLGNVKNGYELRASDPAGQLTFEFIHNGISLEEWQESRVSTIPVAQQPITINAGGSSSAPTPANAARPNVSGVRDGVTKTRRGAHAVASFLGAISQALPFTRGFLQPIVTTLRQGEQTITKAEVSTRRAEQTTNLVKSPFKKIGGAAKPSNSVTKPQTASTRAQPEVSMTGNTFATSLIPTLSWARTPDIAPGDTMKLNLAVHLPRGFAEWNPRSKRQAQVYSFEVQSRPMQQHQDIKIVKHDIRLVRVPWFNRLYPWLAFITFVGIVITIFVTLL